MAIDIDEAKLARNEFGLWAGWTLATMLGMLAGFVPPALIVGSFDLLLVRILVPLWAGFLVGLFQWLVLHRYLTHSADWVLDTGAGWGLGFALGLVIIELIGGSFLGTLIGYILFGIIIGLVQWPILRREVPSVFPWVLASVAGWALGAYLAPVVLSLFVTGGAVNPIVSSTVIAVVTGLVAGGITALALIWIARQPEAPVAGGEHVR